MTTPNDKVVAALNNLIATCKDGQNGYQTAASCVTNPDLKTLFQSYSRQRGQYAQELQDEVARLGGEPGKHGSVTGPVWRAWTNIKSLLSGGSEHAVITECERAEDAAKEAYADALRNTLPPHVQALPERQFAGVKEAHDRIRALEVATGKT